MPEPVTSAAAARHAPGKVSPEEYHALIGQAIALFEGDAKKLEQ